MIAPEQYLVTARSADLDAADVTWIDFVSNKWPAPAAGQTVRVVRDVPGEEPIDGDFMIWRMDAPVPAIRPLQLNPPYLKDTHHGDDQRRIEASRSGDAQTHGREGWSAGAADGDSSAEPPRQPVAAPSGCSLGAEEEGRHFGMTGRPQILPNSPAHDGRQRWRCLTRKVVTPWAPFYASVDFDHEANPVRVQISQPGKIMGAEFGAAIDAISDACTLALQKGGGYVGSVHKSERGDDVPIEIIAVTARSVDGWVNHVAIDWMQRRADLSIQDMLRQIEGAISGLIQEARAT